MSDLRELLGKHYSQNRHRDDQRNRKRYDRSTSPDCGKSKSSKKKQSRRYTEAEDHNKSREVTLGDRSQEILISISSRNIEDTSTSKHSQLPSLSTEGDEIENLVTEAKLKKALKTVDEKDKEIRALKEKVKALESESQTWKVCSEETAEKLRDATKQMKGLMSNNAEYLEKQKSCVKIEPSSIKKEPGVQNQHGKLVETRKKLEVSEKKRKEYKNACLHKKKSLQLKDQEISTLKSENRNLLKMLQLRTKERTKDVEDILTIDISE